MSIDCSTGLGGDVSNAGTGALSGLVAFSGWGEFYKPMDDETSQTLNENKVKMNTLLMNITIKVASMTKKLEGEALKSFSMLQTDLSTFLNNTDSKLKLNNVKISLITRMIILLLFISIFFFVLTK